MRKKDKECKKGSESTIGKIIYGFLLFMPLFAIGVTCITCFWNKEVTADTQTATINYKYETNEVNSYDDLVVGRIYKFNTTNLNEMTGSNMINLLDTRGVKFIEYRTAFFIDFNQIQNIYPVTISYLPSNDNFYFYGRSRNLNLSADYCGTEWYVVYNGNLNTNYVPYTCFSISDYNEIASVDVEETPQTADVKNIFYYAVDKVTESPLFNWAENSIIYTTTNNTCNALSITTPFIPLLLSYWLIISVMYFLYDIALMLVWMVHRKIHELQESF